MGVSGVSVCPCERKNYARGRGLKAPRGPSAQVCLRVCGVRRAVLFTRREGKKGCYPILRRLQRSAQLPPPPHAAGWQWQQRARQQSQHASNRGGSHSRVGVPPPSLPVRHLLGGRAARSVAAAQGGMRGGDIAGLADAGTGQRQQHNAAEKLPCTCQQSSHASKGSRHRMPGGASHGGA